MTAINRDRASHNKSGQTLGRKGADTRDRVLAALQQLLVTSRGVEPTAAAIARAASISAPAFYLYFSDVGDALLAALGQLEESVTPVLRLEEDWPADRQFALAHEFVEAYVDYWEANAPLLRARNRLADQGDARFVVLRIHSASRLSNALVRKLSDPPFPTGLACSPLAAANAVVVALERMATIMVLNLYPSIVASREDNIMALANLLGMTLSGRVQMNPA